MKKLRAFLAALLLVAPLSLSAQQKNVDANISRIGGGVIPSGLYDSLSNALRINCVTGCSGSGGGGGFAQLQVRNASNVWTDIGYSSGNLNIPIQGAVTATISGSVSVTGAFWQATQPVSGPLTDTQLRASAVPVSGSLGRSWTLGNGTDSVSAAVSNFPSTYPPATPAALADSQANPTTPSIGAYVSVFDGTNWQRARGDATNGLWVNLKASVALSVNATQTGTWTVQPGNTANSTPWLTTDSATSSTGAALPAKATFVGVRDSSANLSGVVQCDKFAQVSIATATTTAIVAVSGATTIYVCSYAVEIQGVATTAGTLQLEYGAGTACVTSPTVVTPAYIGSTTAGNPTVIAQTAGLGFLFKTPASQGLCAVSTTTTAQKVFITYAQF